MTDLLGLDTLVSGLLSGAIYALIALGFTIVYGVMRIINFAHGELVMLGMFGGYLAWSEWALDPLLSLPIVALAVGAIGALIYSAAIRPILSAPHFNQLVMTFGLLILIQSIMLLLFGGELRTVKVGYVNSTVEFAGVVVSVPRLIAAGGAALVTAAVYVFLERTRAGSALRACSQDELGYAVVGGRVRRTQLLAFALSAALAAVAGVFIASYSTITPFGGVDFTVTAFLVVLLGGLGRVEGTLLAGLLFGVLEAYARTLMTPGMATAALFAAVVAIILVRPQGLLRGTPA